MKTSQALEIIKEHSKWLELEKASEIIGRQMYKISCGTGRVFNLDFENIEVTEKEITVNFSYYYCGERDDYDYTFPVEWFDDENWQDKYMVQLVKANEQWRKEQEEKRVLKEFKDKESRKEFYLKLKKEFEA